MLDPCNSDPFYFGRWLLCVGAGATLFFVTLNGLMHQWNDDKANIKLPVRVAIRACCVIAMCVVPLAGKGEDDATHVGTRSQFLTTSTAMKPIQYLGIGELLRVAHFISHTVC